MTVPWLTIEDLRLIREAIADDAARIFDEEFAAIALEVAKHDRSRAAKLGHRTRKANKAKRMKRTTLRLQEERRAGA